MVRPPFRDAAAIEIRPVDTESDWDWLAGLWRDEWGGETMVSRGVIHKLVDQTALIAWRGETRMGAATFFASGRGWELTSINALEPGLGIGSALLRAVEDAARSAGAPRLWMITTNDNLDALRFYQRRGYRLVAVHAGAVDDARELKPSIPEIGNHGIPIHDEIELEKRFD
ncbi:MAG: GNAT family N-acetyltransferase [Thermomicrobiales bacterium]